MTTVTVTEFRGPRSLRLDAVQTGQFLLELRRVRWFFLFGLVTRGRPGRVNPSAIVRVERNGRVTEYELFGGQVLIRRGTRRPYPFYFGHLLLQWLYQ